MFTRGYKELNTKLNNKPKFLMNCLNCKYYFMEENEEEEYCQNEQVLEYDMIIEETRTYCLHWESV